MTTESSRLPTPGTTLHAAAWWLAHGLSPAVVAVVRNHRSARILVSLCMAVFAGLAVIASTSEHVLLTVDTVVQDAVINSRSGVLDATMMALTELGTRYSIGVLTFALVLWSATSGRGHRFVFVVVAAVILNPVFEVTFKELVGRVRPDAAQLVPGNGPSFPSGHVLASVGFYGLMPLLAWHTTRNAFARFAALAGSLVIIGGVAASRVYLDVHWMTDVVAGLVLGLVLVAVSYHSYLAIERKRATPTEPPTPLPAAAGARSFVEDLAA